MRSNYKKLGKYIQQINKRNTDLNIDRLLGVSINKVLMPSIANTVGTNMKTYKIIKKNQFAYGPVTSRNGDKISIALLQEFDEAILSQAYTVFEVIDETELHPEYLMMWFRRPEFDRYARFKSHGSARETFDWDEMCEVELPIPSIEKQREIVKEYNTVVNRIKLNEQLNQKLEETAQALYKHWFVDFEFPNENGEPYKSSGGAMVYNEELDKEIPEGWEVKILDFFVKDSLGGDWGKESPTGNYTEKVRCIRGTDIPLFKSGDLESAPVRYILFKNLKSRQVSPNQIVIEISGGSPTQSTGRAVLVSENHLDRITDKIICSNFCRTLKIISSEAAPFFYSHLNYLYEIDYLFNFENSTTGVKNFDLSGFLNEEYLVKPPTNELSEFSKRYNVIQLNQLVNRGEISKLNCLKELLLSKMTKVEQEKVVI